MGPVLIKNPYKSTENTRTREAVEPIYVTKSHTRGCGGPRPPRARLGKTPYRHELPPAGSSVTVANTFEDGYDIPSEGMLAHKYIIEINTPTRVGLEPSPVGGSVNLVLNK